MDASIQFNPISRTANRRRFGAAHAARSLGWSCVDLLLAWHLHVVVGLTGGQTGGLLFVFLMVGGAANLLVGIGLSRLRADGTLVVQVQLWGAFAAALSLWLQFALVAPVHVILIGLVFRLAYAVQDVAQNMLASLLPADNEEADDYARLRVVLSATMRCLVISGYAVTAHKTFAVTDQVSTMVAIIAFVMIGSAFSLRHLTFPCAIERSERRHDRRDVPSGLPGLLAAFAVSSMFLPTLNRLLIFSPATAGMPESGAWLLAAFCLGLIVGPTVERRTGWRMLVVAVGVSGLVMIAPLAGVWQLVGAVVHGVAISAICVQLWARAARIAMDDALTGRRRDGIVFGAVIFVIHLSSAVGMLILGPLIEGFEAGHRTSAQMALALTVMGALSVSVMSVNGRRSFAMA